MEKPFNLTPRVKEDLRGIWAYSFEQWSEAQADKYIAELYKRFAWLAFRARVGGIDFIGVPHKEMDVVNYFDA